MMAPKLTIDRRHATRLDTLDPLAAYRKAFVISDANMVYADGNSLGRLPRQTARHMRSLVDDTWGNDLIRGWNKGWYEAPSRVGDKIGQLVGAAFGQVIVSDSTSVNLYKLTMAALTMRSDRTKIISDNLNFPSDLYIMQGCCRQLGRRHCLHLVSSSDGLSVDAQTLLDSIDEQTALVSLSHVAFKSGFLYDAEAVTRRAHEVGALVLWDLSHSVSAVPISL